MEEKRLRVALFGGFYSEGGESIESQKERLREEARRRNYVIVDEFWEEDLPADTSFEERPEIKRLLQSVWTNELDIDGLFLPDLDNLRLSARKEHMSLMVMFEQNDIALITWEATYNPEDWLAGFSF